MNQIAPPKSGHQRGSQRLLQGLAISVLLTLPTFADSISPASVSQSIATGGSVTIHKTVTVNATTSSSAVDIVFIADNTGSMYTAIHNVQTAASSMLTTLSGLANVQFGVAMYQDQYDSPSFNMLQNLTGNTGLVQTAINGWFAGGGGDYPESYQNALLQVANTTTWRPGSQRFAVWFGDAPSHPEAGGINGGGVDLVTTTDAINALVANGIRGEAINVGTGDSYAPYGGIYTGLNDAGQASQIATATGGTFFNTLNPTTVASTIVSAITTGVTNYSVVSLDTSGAPAGVGVTFTPPSYVGTYDRSIDRNFDFDVTFTGVTPGTYNFDIYGTVDGARVATERDHIVVGGTVPDAGSTLMLLAGAVGLLAALRRRFVA